MVAELDLNLCRQVSNLHDMIHLTHVLICQAYTTRSCISHILCGTQVRDQWGFQMTARYEMYAKLLKSYIQPQFQPQIIKEAQ